MLELLLGGIYLWLFKKFALGGSWTGEKVDAYESKNYFNIASMSSRDFEFHCASFLERFGHKCKVTGQSGDGNIDIYVEDPQGNLVGIAECKHWKKEVGVAPLKILYATMLDQGVTQSWFFSLNGFSVSAENYAKDMGNYYITLIDGRNM
jgi:restriction system protein